MQKRNGWIKLIEKSNRYYRLPIGMMILSFVLSCCQQGKVKSDNSDKDIVIMNDNSDKVKKTLIIQMKEGANRQYGGRLGLESLFILADSILTNNSYKKTTINEMKERIKYIYGFEPLNIEPDISYIFGSNELAKEDNGTIMDIINTEVIAYDNSIYSPLYISYKHHLVTYAFYIPEVVDYQKLYPDLFELENSTLHFLEYDEYEGGEVWYDGIHWKDIPNLKRQQKENQDFITHLNKYLFNNRDSSLTWLLNNNIDFLFRLVTVFGYDKEDKINKKLIQSVYDNFSKLPLENKFETLENVFVKRMNDNQLNIRVGLFQSLLDLLTKDDSDMHLMLRLYSYEIEKQKEKFSEKEINEILAYIGYYDYLICEKFNSEPKWILYGNEPLLLNIIRNNKSFEKELESEQYYNLPNYSDIIDQVYVKLSFDEELKKEMDEMRRVSEEYK